MATPFTPQQKLSQDEKGETLALIDFSNYNGVIPVPEDKYVNSIGNDDNVDLADFISRRWILETLNGDLREAVFNYEFPQNNRCSILVPKDEFLSITMIIKTATDTYTSKTETGLHRRAEYKLYKLSKAKCCGNKQKEQTRNEAKNFVDSAKYKLTFFDRAGFNTDINSANTLLNSI